LASLIEDLTLYPRHRVDDFHVAEMIKARAAGCRFPPIVIDRASRRIVDGWHRVRMCRRLELVSVLAELRRYESEQQMFADAMALNVHGRSLTTYDKVRCITIADRLGIDREQLATLIGLTPTRIETLLAGRTAPRPEGGLQPLKRTAGHLAGEQLSEPQVRGNERSSGMSPLFYVGQVRNLLAGGLIDRANAALLQALRDLQHDLEVFLDEVEE
jgi:hypothetical protein